MTDLLGLLSTLKMEATCFSETSIDLHRTTLRYIPEDRFAWLTLNPEDGGDMLLRNIG
jgi:hypothetical protein